LTLRIESISRRLIPLLALLLLETPMNWVGLICHEGGHGVVALAQGGTFTGILLTQTVSYAMANSSLTSIGGWMGQYALAIAALLLYRRIKPRSFLGRSVLAVLIVQNLIGEPPYIASLQGDSAATLGILEKAGFGSFPSIAILEIAALVLGVIGVYGAWRIFRTYLSGTFSWIGGRRASWASLIFVIGSAAYAWFADLVPTEAAVANNLLFQAVSLAAFLAVFSLVVIPPMRTGSPAVLDRGPTTATVVFVVLLFVEAQLVYLFVLPIMIPIP
jgi:hypothetical protein